MMQLLSTRLLHAIDQRKTGSGKKYTVYRLSKDTGLDYGYVHRVVNGKHNPSRETLAKICQALNCSPEEKTEIYHAAGYLTPEELEEEERVA